MTNFSFLKTPNQGATVLECLITGNFLCFPPPANSRPGCCQSVPRLCGARTRRSSLLRCGSVSWLTPLPGLNVNHKHIYQHFWGTVKQVLCSLCTRVYCRLYTSYRKLLAQLFLDESRKRRLQLSP